MYWRLIAAAYLTRDAIVCCSQSKRDFTGLNTDNLGKIASIFVTGHFPNGIVALVCLHTNHFYRMFKINIAYNIHIRDVIKWNGCDCVFSYSLHFSFHTVCHQFLLIIRSFWECVRVVYHTFIFKFQTFQSLDLVRLGCVRTSDFWFSHSAEFKWDSTIDCTFVCVEFPYRKKQRISRF